MIPAVSQQQMSLMTCQQLQVTADDLRRHIVSICANIHISNCRYSIYFILRFNRFNIQILWFTSANMSEHIKVCHQNFAMLWCWNKKPLVTFWTDLIQICDEAMRNIATFTITINDRHYHHHCHRLICLLPPKLQGASRDPSVSLSLLSRAKTVHFRHMVAIEHK